MKSSDYEGFVSALQYYVNSTIKEQDVEYSQIAIKIVDARNYFFRKEIVGPTDESSDVFALRDMCMLDENMKQIACEYKIRNIARNYFPNN